MLGPNRPSRPAKVGSSPSLHACGSLVAALLLFGPAQEARAQDAADSAAADGPVRIFLDCEGQLCDFDYFRRQLPYVTWVRDRQVADVHILVTEEDTGGGGERFNLDFIGGGRFQGLERRLSFSMDPTQTEAEGRDDFLRIMALGLVNYVAGTPAAQGLRIVYEEGPADQPIAPVQVSDPWDRWVFEIDLGGSYDSESRETSFSLDGGLSVNRTTPEWKIDLGVEAEYNEERFDLEDREVVSTQESFGIQSVVVRSIGGNWSAGAQASIERASRRNQDLSVRLGPALEYSVFPYSESSTRQLTFLYALSAEHFDYNEVTVFEELSEMRSSQTLNISLDAQQPWGELNVSVEGAHFLSDPQQNRMSVFGRVELQVVEGLSVDIEASASRIRDQIYLPEGEASDEEILVGEREFRTDFATRLELGFSYTFGSIFSDVVNTRFESMTGGFDGGDF